MRPVKPLLDLKAPIVPSPWPGTIGALRSRSGFTGRIQHASVRRGGDDPIVREVKPIWTSASFLVYTGGFIVLASAIGALAYLSGHYESGAEAGWAFLVLVVLYAIAHAFRIRRRA